MIRQWAQALGLAETSLFAPSEEVEGGEHKLLLDGIRGSFSVSQIDGADIQSDSRSWAWSSGVLHHPSVVLIIGQRLPIGIADDEAPPIQVGVGFLDRPGRREAAGGHGVDHLPVERRSSFTIRIA